MNVVPTSERVLNIAALMKETRMVGPGLRDAVWVQGCTIDCPGCANQAYMPHVRQLPMGVERLAAHFRARRNVIDGVSVLGGEPTEQPKAVASLLADVQRVGLSTVVFSGCRYEALRRDPSCAELLAHTDLLIDGPYVRSEKDSTLHWRGSRNQRLLRLSGRFTEKDLEPPCANGEIVISPVGLRVHGVGTCGIE